MSIFSNASGSLTSVNAPPANFSWLFWWMWVGTPSAAFHTVISIDNGTTFYAVQSAGGTQLQANAAGGAATNTVDPGNEWICLAGISLGASASTNIFLAKRARDRSWTSRFTQASAAVRAGSVILCNESALDQSSAGVIQGFKSWGELKTEPQLLLESAQLAPIDATNLWSYPFMDRLQGAGNDLRGRNSFTSAGTFVLDGREPPVPVQLAPRSMWHPTLSLR